MYQRDDTPDEINFLKNLVNIFQKILKQLQKLNLKITFYKLLDFLGYSAI